MARVVILGAGLTGLSVAYHLEQEGFYNFKVFEKNDRPGGLLQSFSQDGFTFDYTGHLLHINNDYFKGFLNTVVHLNDLLHVKRNAGIFSHDVLTEYPFQNNLHGLPYDVIYNCIHGFINRKKSLKKPKSFYEWVLKYFGNGLGQHFFYSFQKKLLSYDLKKIDHSWTGRFVPKTTLSDILQGALKVTDQQKFGYNSTFYYPKSGGIEFLIRKITSHLKTPTSTHHAAVKIDMKSKTIMFENGRLEPFDILITTMPLPKLLQCIKEPSHLEFKHAQYKLKCASVINFNLGFNQKNISEKQWIYFPEKKYPFYRIGFWNNINPFSVPQGMSAIYGETSFLHRTKTKKQIDNVTQKSINHALSFLQLNKQCIVTQKILCLDYAYVTYDQWRKKNLPKLLEKLKDFNIFSIGRFGAWKYSSMQEAVLEGQKIAQNILKEKKHLKKENIFPAITFVEKGQKNMRHKQILQKSS